MKRLYCILITISSVCFCYAQNLDFLLFCNYSNWQTIIDKENITIRELRTKDIFGAQAHIYVMTIDTSLYRLGLMQEAKKERTSKLMKMSKAVAAVNGGFFRIDKQTADRAIPNDFLKINGRIVSPYPTSGWGDASVGFTSSTLHFTPWNKAINSDTLSGWSSKFQNVIVAGPMLIFNGHGIENSDTSRHPRTAIGVDKNGRIVLVVVDGRRRRAAGATFMQMTQIGQWLGLNNMMNLDGGGSSTMVYDGRTVNFPSDGQGLIPLERKVANAIVVYAK